MNIKSLLNKAYENRADIAFVGGMILTVVGTGAAIVATHKNHDTIEEHKTAMANLNEDLENNTISEEEFKEERKKVVKETVKKTAKAYAIPGGMFVAGQVMELYSHRTQKLAIKGLEMTVAGFAAKLVEDVKEHPFELPVVEEGEAPVMQIADRDFVYEYLFDKTNSNYNDAPWANKYFLQQMEDSWNRSFPNMEEVVVCELIRSLGATPAVDFRSPGAMTILPYKNEDGSVNHISFGLDYNDQPTRRFRMGLEPSVKLRIRLV